jgi:hypothetical protein
VIELYRLIVPKSTRMDRGLLKIHWISERVPLSPRWRPIDLLIWFDTFELLVSNRMARAYREDPSLPHMTYSTLYDSDGHQLIWTVGIPEGVNASKFYCQYMRGVGCA